MLPYGTGICRYAFIYIKKIVSVHYFLIHFLCVRSGIAKSTEWSTIPACPSVMFFCNGNNTKGTNFGEIMFDVCVCMICLYKFVSGLIL